MTDTTSISQAIRSSKWPFQLYLWSLWIAQSTAWFYWATLITIDQVAARNPFESTCHNLGPIPGWTWIMYLSVAFMDVLILVLTLQMHLKRFIDVKNLLQSFSWNSSTKIDLAQVFYQDTVMHFIVSVTVTLILSVWFAHHRHDPFYAILIAPMWVLLPFFMSCLFYLNHEDCSHVWLNLSISPRVIRSLKLHAAKANLSRSDQSQAASPNAAVSSLPSQESKRHTRDYYEHQPGIPFESCNVERISAADVIYPPLSPQLGHHSHQPSPILRLQHTQYPDHRLDFDIVHPFSRA